MMKNIAKCDVGSKNPPQLACIVADEVNPSNIIRYKVKDVHHHFWATGVVGAIHLSWRDLRRHLTLRGLLRISGRQPTTHKHVGVQRYRRQAEESVSTTTTTHWLEMGGLIRPPPDEQSLAPLIGDLMLIWVIRMWRVPEHSFTRIADSGANSFHFENLWDRSSRAFHVILRGFWI